MTNPFRLLFVAAALLATPDTPTARLAPPTTGRIGGHVRDASGTPIAHAQVLVVGTSFGAITNADGAYRIDSIPAGTYVVRARFIGYAPTETGNVQVKPGRTVKVDLILHASPLQVNGVTVIDGAPAAGRQQVSSSAKVMGLALSLIHI